MELPQGISRIMEVSAKSSAADLDRVAATLAAAKNQVREIIQDLTGPQMEAIVKKLEDRAPLTQEEKDYVRSWIIGDAEGYTRVENHLRAWLQEFKALQNAVKGYEGKEATVQDWSNLHAVLEDAERVAGQIQGFLEKKERIERFDLSLRHLDQEDPQFIVGILRGQMQSEEV